MRPSNTEPIVRVIAESSSESAARALAERAEAEVETLLGLSSEKSPPIA